MAQDRELFDQVPGVRTTPRLGALDRLLTSYRAIQAAEADVDEVLRLTVDHAATLLAADLCAIWRPAVPPSPREGSVVAAVGLRVEPWAAQLGPDETGVGRRSIDTDAPVAEADYQAFAAAAGPPTNPYLGWSEGATAVLCVPLREVGQDGAAGVLYVARRQRQAFSRTDVDVASALAGQAALVLRNGRLRRALTDQHDLVLHAARVADRLAQAASEGGVDGVRWVLQREVGRRVDVLPDPVENHPDGVAVVPVVAGRAHLGELHVHGRPLNRADAVTIERATSLIAQELARERSAEQGRLRTGAQLLAALLDGVPVDEPYLAERARRLGFDIRRPLSIVAVDHDGLDLAQLRALVDDGDDAVLVAQVARGAAMAIVVDDERLVRSLVDALLEAPSVRGVGVSTPGEDVRAAGEEAFACLALARERSHGRAVVAGDFGLLTFLLGTADPVATMRRHVARVLGPVIDQQARGSAPLLATLDQHLRCGRRLGTTAAVLGVHPNTVKYRLGRIAALTGPIDSTTALDLWTALRARELLAGLGQPPDPNGD